MVGRPQARRSAVAQVIADNIGVHGTETFFRGTIAEQHEIEPLGECGRSVAQVFLMSPGVAQLPRVLDAPGICEARVDQVTVSRRAATTCPRVEVASKDYREVSIGRSFQDLLALLRRPDAPMPRASFAM
jgi:hypothetical protein